ncbi:MAG: recombinase family protein [Candidatus Thiodiazotropha sp.]
MSSYFQWRDERRKYNTLWGIPPSLFVGLLSPASLKLVAQHNRENQPMKVAIYARKSTDDDRNEDNKSVKRQVRSAKAYAKKMQWVVDDDHIYIDDGISGAEYQNRPGFTRLLTNLKDFDVLLMSESSRLGRDMLRNAYHVGEIIDNGVRIFYYLTEEEEKADTPEQKIMITLKSYASEVEREKASQRSRDALERKATKGYNTGGVVYGYDNHQVMVTNAQGEEVKSHTEFRINNNQADVIRSIFRMYADGHGHTIIARTLNGDPRYKHKSDKYFKGQTPPSPRKGTGSWAPSSVRAILYNVRYTGVIPFGKFKKAYRNGTKKRIKQESYHQIEVPKLRIVSEKLWSEVQKRLESVKKTYIRDTNGNLWGRPGMGRESKYLLTGLGRCACCGSNITLIGGKSGSPGKRKSIFYYGCSYHKNRGQTVCANDHKEHMDVLDSAVLEAIEMQILTPEAVVYTVEKALEIVEQQLKTDPEQVPRLEAERTKLRGELDRFMNLIASGKAPEAVLEQITQREERIKQVEMELGQLDTANTGNELDRKRLRNALEDRIGRFKGLVYSDVPLARQALRKLLVEPIEFRPVVLNGRKTYSFEGKTRIGALLDPGYIAMASPRGVEPLLPA